ncbi:g5422 [Coccomyxa elongata]
MPARSTPGLWGPTQQNNSRGAARRPALAAAGVGLHGATVAAGSLLLPTRGSGQHEEISSAGELADKDAQLCALAVEDDGALSLEDYHPDETGSHPAGSVFQGFGFNGS